MSSIGESGPPTNEYAAKIASIAGVTQRAAR
jgi:hypothetical protein